MDAARREFLEELGVAAPDVAYAELGTFPYSSGKRIVVFVGDGAEFEAAELEFGTFELEWPPRSGRTQSFPEVDRAEWMPVAEAHPRLVKGQRPALDALARHLEELGAAGPSERVGLAGPGHVAVRSQQHGGHVQLVADVDHVVDPVRPPRDRERTGLVEQQPAAFVHQLVEPAS